MSRHNTLETIGDALPKWARRLGAEHLFHVCCGVYLLHMDGGDLDGFAASNADAVEAIGETHKARAAAARRSR